ncbi:SAM hydrolase/SAM-dependent halogenase family protein [Kaarinaea lacus]
MIVLFTDFGFDGPYVGQMKAVLATRAPGATVIDLMHDAPNHDIQASAYLLASLVSEFPENSVFLCVVDPGVGSERKPIVVKVGAQWFVGPDNGLFNVVMLFAEGKQKIERWVIDWKPARLSSSFHGRDLFAPVAAMLEKGEPVPGNLVEADSLTTDLTYTKWPADLTKIIYIDHFGNAMTGIRGDVLTTNQTIIVNGYRFGWARTFSDVNLAEGFWTINSNGLVEIAVNQGSACNEFALKVGDDVNVVVH